MEIRNVKYQRSTPRRLQHQRALSFIAGFAVSLAAASSNAAVIDIAQVPLHLGGQVKPNIMFLLDDSGSMQWDSMPDEMRNVYATNYVYPLPAANVYIGSNFSNWVATPEHHIYSALFRSSAVNKIYYNPEVTYLPWKKADGTSYPNASITAAWHNPENTAAGSRNLTADNPSPGSWDKCDHTGTSWTSGWTCSSPTTPATFWPAFYYKHNGTGDIWTLANYTRVEIRPTPGTYTPATFTGSANRTDCAAAPACTYAEEIQNFANWYTYYRSRILAVRGGVGHAFAQLPQTTDPESAARVGFGSINKGNTTVDGVPTDTIITGVRPFISTDRSTFFTNLYTRSISGSTPLRAALDDAGQYYKRSVSTTSPWDKTPGNSSDTTNELSCRQSYSILTTDGYWNDDQASTNGARQNNDGTDGTIPNPITGPGGKSYTYTAKSPFSDSWSDTLADVAMYYWKQDLRTDLSNDVPANPQDPAFWQHMVTFGVSLGLEGAINKDDAFDAISSGATITWPQPFSGATTQNLDDLLHAAVNSRGDFFSAKDPQAFAAGLAGTLNAISNRTSSASAIATNSTRLDTNTLIYQAKYDSSDWSGHLLAFALNTDGTVGGQAWDAANLIPSEASRNIYTHNGTTGLAFTAANFSNLSANQQANLNSDVNILKYLRGDQSKEVKNGGTFRNRSVLLGDIINSDPWYVGRADYGYSILPDVEGDSYSNFINSDAYKNRTTMIYVGSNDGMLHAINASSGVEKFAYVPRNIYNYASTDPNYKKLASLASTSYTHKYFVDGSPRAGDAYINRGTGLAWHTILAGATGAGGKSVFALDVTYPDSFGASNVMWEFTHAELGTTIGQPAVVRMQNGQWAVVFGNGYNSTSNTARLFIVDATTGALIKAIDTQVGDSTTPNGLATPIAVDTDGDRSADHVYAGDLYGNMWSFDLSATNVTSWGSAYKSGSKPAPLFTAKSPDGTVQAITTKPQVGLHPDGGLMVYFGTGKYFSTGDNTLPTLPTLPQVHSLYGIWDSGVAVASRTDLLEQKIIYENSATYNGYNYDIRLVSKEPMTSTKKGWFMDLISVPPANLGKQGERVISPALLWADRVIFTTMIPDPNPCNYGGTSWLMELDPLTGGRLDFSVFDLNHDGLFNNLEYAVDPTTGQKIPVSGKKSKEGIVKTPGVINADDKSFKYTSGSTGNIEVTSNKGQATAGRQSWQQLK